MNAMTFVPFWNITAGTFQIIVEVGSQSSAQSMTTRTRPVVSHLMVTGCTALPVVFQVIR
jgi:hypothetical protein